VARRCGAGVVVANGGAASGGGGLTEPGGIVSVSFDEDVGAVDAQQSVVVSPGVVGGHALSWMAPCQNADLSAERV
jgi:hypothetical protein